jgi:hypothetical protein
MKKTRKRRNRRQQGRQSANPVRANRLGGKQQRKAETEPAKWLRIVPAGIDEDPNVYAPRGLFSLRNSRRPSKDVDLYFPEGK